MEITKVQTAITQVKQGADAVLTTIEAIDPAEQVPVEIAIRVVDELAILAAAAITAWSAASGQPITPESIAGLMVNVPLDAPDA